MTRASTYVTETGVAVSLCSDSAMLRLGVSEAVAIRQDLLGARFRTTSALLAIMSRAEGLLLRVCCECRSVLGVRDADGAKGGISHGYCPPCYETVTAAAFASCRTIRKEEN